jgi:hypothetical protein
VKRGDHQAFRQQSDEMFGAGFGAFKMMGVLALTFAQPPLNLFQAWSQALGFALYTFMFWLADLWRWLLGG